MKPLVYKKAKRVRRQPPVRQKLHITKGDTVQLISGEEKGKRGTVLRADPKTGRVVVQGINLVKRHRRATPQNEAGIVTMEAPIHPPRVMLTAPRWGEPPRIGRGKDRDGGGGGIAVKWDQPIPRNR